MKNKSILFAIVILILGTCLWCDLQLHYKKGKILLKGVEWFGNGCDWEELIYDPYKDMAVAPDGSIFVVNGKIHNVFKFDRNGKFLKKFGNRGSGPGDFVHPDDLSILDNKYLVIGEYAINRRFSLWDFNGNCVKVVKTGTSIFNLTALRDNRVAYYYYCQNAEKKNGFQSTIAIIIKDIGSNKEKILEKITLLDRSEIILEQNSSTGLGNFFGEVYLSQTIDGDLAVGVSNRPRIDIFAPTGEKIRSFQLEMVPIPASKTFIKEFRDNVLAEYYGKDVQGMDRTEKYWHELFLKKFRTFDFSTIFDHYLPFYKEILIDSEGNFLVFKFGECLKACNPVFQVYSKTGAYVCETLLEKGAYEFEIDRRFKNICFTSSGIFGIFMKRGDEDEAFAMVKSIYPPLP